MISSQLLPALINRTSRRWCKPISHLRKFPTSQCSSRLAIRRSTISQTLRHKLSWPCLTILGLSLDKRPHLVTLPLVLTVPDHPRRLLVMAEGMLSVAALATRALFVVPQSVLLQVWLLVLLCMVQPCSLLPNVTANEELVINVQAA